MRPRRCAARRPSSRRCSSRPSIRTARRAWSCVQTHISYVFLAGDAGLQGEEAGPLRLPRLLHARAARATSATRRCASTGAWPPTCTAACWPSAGAAAALRSAPEDAAGAVEYAVHMRRLPADRMLAHLLERGAGRRRADRRIAARLAASTPPPTPARRSRAAATRPSIGRAVRRRLRARSTRFHGDTISAADDAAIQRFCRAFLQRHDALLRRRQARGPHPRRPRRSARRAHLLHRSAVGDLRLHRVQPALPPPRRRRRDRLSRHGPRVPRPRRSRRPAGRALRRARRRRRPAAAWCPSTPASAPTSAARSTA